MRWISMLRGINVSGHNQVKMADLKRAYEKLGLTQVETYIQSGNVIFDTPHPVEDRLELCHSLERTVAEQCGVDVPIVLRTNQELKQIIDQYPFKAVNQPDTENRSLITFFYKPPTKEGIGNVLAQAKSDEKFILLGNEAYLFCPNGYGKSKLSNAYLEKQLKSPATTRNLKTVKKLFELSN